MKLFALCVCLDRSYEVKLATVNGTERKTTKRTKEKTTELPFRPVTLMARREAKNSAEDEERGMLQIERMQAGETEEGYGGSERGTTGRRRGCDMQVGEARR
jgi:hypothetical protein